jgi:adenylate cyclase
MSDVFISYARSTAIQAQQVTEALRGLGYSVWIDDDLPAHRTYGRVIEEQMTAAKAAVVIWSVEAAQSEWVLSEANRAREERKLVQVATDTARLPMPFDTIQCAELVGWTGDTDAPGWRKVVASIAELVGGTAGAAEPAPIAPLPLPSKPSIAVMPFANISGDPEQEYFADGMVVEIVEALSRIRSIFVIASGSCLSFKGKKVGPQDAARQLGVRYVLEGSVRKAGGRVRIGVQLIDAADGAQLWTHRFEDTLEDVFALQDRVALAVAGKIEPTVQQAEIRRALARPTENMGSYDLYLRALPLTQVAVKSEYLEALDLLNRAIALDPDYAPALALAARCLGNIVSYRWSEDLETCRRQGIELAHRALKVGGDDATVVAWAAFGAEYLERDRDAALALIERAIALNPGSSFAWGISAVLRISTPDVAIEHVETAMRLDPMGPRRAVQMAVMGWARFCQGRFSETVALVKEQAQLSPSPNSAAFLAASYGHLGQPSTACEALARYRALSAQPIDEYGRTMLHDPAHLKLFLDGIAMAEGKSPSDSATTAQ